jgi:hypothetical protein
MMVASITDAVMKPLFDGSPAFDMGNFSQALQ